MCSLLDCLLFAAYHFVAHGASYDFIVASLCAAAGGHYIFLLRFSRCVRNLFDDPAVLIDLCRSRFIAEILITGLTGPVLSVTFLRTSRIYGCMMLRIVSGRSALPLIRSVLFGSGFILEVLLTLSAVPVLVVAAFRTAWFDRCMMLHVMFVFERLHLYSLLSATLSTGKFLFSCRFFCRFDYYNSLVPGVIRLFYFVADGTFVFVQVFVLILPVTPIMGCRNGLRFVNGILMFLIGKHFSAMNAGPVLRLPSFGAGRFDSISMVHYAMLAFDRNIYRFATHSANGDIPFIGSDIPRITIGLIIFITIWCIYSMTIFIDEASIVPSIGFICILLVSSFPCEGQFISIVEDTIARIFV